MEWSRRNDETNQNNFSDGLSDLLIQQERLEEI